jgi:hypothetical protein
MAMSQEGRRGGEFELDQAYAELDQAILGHDFKVMMYGSGSGVRVVRGFALDVEQEIYGEGANIEEALANAGASVRTGQQNGNTYSAGGRDLSSELDETVLNYRVNLEKSDGAVMAQILNYHRPEVRIGRATSTQGAIESALQAPIELRS